jgi:hypothetical protein
MIKYFCDELGATGIRGERGVTGATGIRGKYPIIETGYIDFNTATIHTNESRLTDKISRAKCSYCGQYATRYDSCNHCGAPVE